MKYQVILTEQDDVVLKTTNLVNPAVFLSASQEEESPEHDCIMTTEHTYSSQEDLKDVLFEDPEWELFTDGSSFVQNGTRYAGYAGPSGPLLEADTVSVKEADGEGGKPTKSCRCPGDSRSAVPSGQRWCAPEDNGSCSGSH
ncbi:uncharacterized protein O3Q21_014898 isoform 1-T1 [Podargus strigoides]